MKKKVLIIIICILILIVSIIVLKPKKDGKLICTYKYKDQDITITTKYIVNYKNKYVTNLKTIEKITSDNQTILIEYRDKLKENYSLYNDIKYYDNKVRLIQNTVTSTTEINYNKIDINKLIELDKNNKYLFEDKKIHLNKFKELYKKNGAKCKYK